VKIRGVPESVDAKNWTGLSMATAHWWRLAGLSWRGGGARINKKSGTGEIKKAFRGQRLELGGGSGHHEKIESFCEKGFRDV